MPHAFKATLGKLLTPVQSLVHPMSLLEREIITYQLVPPYYLSFQCRDMAIGALSTSATASRL